MSPSQQHHLRRQALKSALKIKHRINGPKERLSEKPTYSVILFGKHMTRKQDISINRLIKKHLYSQGRRRPLPSLRSVGGGTKVKGPQVVVSELKVLYNYVKQGTEIQADLNLSTFSFNYTSQCMCFMLYNSFNLCFAVSERRIGGLLVYTDMRRPMPACLPRHMQMRMGPIKR